LEDYSACGLTLRARRFAPRGAARRTSGGWTWTDHPVEDRSQVNGRAGMPGLVANKSYSVAPGMATPAPGAARLFLTPTKKPAAAGCFKGLFGWFWAEWPARWKIL